jgi:hypothetical protein
MDAENEAGSSSQQSTGYSWQVGSVYVFNLMVATGLVTLPKAFVEVGWVLGLVVLCVLGFMSYCTVTFIIEAQAIHNALLLHISKEKEENEIGPGVTEELDIHNVVIKNKTVVSYYNDTVEIVNLVENGQSTMRRYNAVEESHSDVTGINNVVCNAMQQSFKPELEQTLEVDVNPPEYLYEITLQTDLGELCKTFFSTVGVILYYVAICIYLYGSITIHLTAIAKSLTSVVCDDPNCFDGNDTAPCKMIKNLSVIHTYRIFVAVSVVLCSPFIFFSLTKSKILQICTTLFRWFALTSMIILALLRIGKGEGHDFPNLAVLTKLPNFIGVALYVFMVQFSIPNVVTPITNKHRLNLSIMVAFFCVVVVGASLLLTAVVGLAQSDWLICFTLIIKYNII